MRSYTVLFSFLLLSCIAAPCFAQETPSENIVGRMTVKFTRGVTNVATSVVEIPKQSYLTIRDQGMVGYVTGPLKGLGMTVYRAFIGAAETVFFLVPQPGYYDPMINPEFVWNGWEERRTGSEKIGEAGSPELIVVKKGE
jgi:putative exosortase-associated protein (TIGR04073 family)